MFTLVNFFGEDEGLTPCIMNSSIIFLLGLRFLATVEFLIHKVYVFKQFELKL